ncbi:MAG: metal-dependent transcriptional regulator [Armatimonadota bacterium]|jgi:DtxR family Mn-dependent transcriptional regulator
MDERELTESAEELLGSLWTAREEQSVPRGAGDGPEVHELAEAGLIVSSAQGAALTEAGEAEAAAIVRRERLAERLLADVLAVGDSVATEAACRFEHLLRRGIDDQICTLLGHPRVCPHGSPIPLGECCRSGAEDATRVVSPLADMAAGEKGVIAYIQSQRREHLHRLMTMGALPGAPITLRQRFPSFVFDLGNGQVAVDEDTARDIYVRLDGQTHAAAGRPHWLARRLRRSRPTRSPRGRP